MYCSVRLIPGGKGDAEGGSDERNDGVDRGFSVHTAESADSEVGIWSVQKIWCMVERLE